MIKNVKMWPHLLVWFISLGFRVTNLEAQTMLGAEDSFNEISADYPNEMNPTWMTPRNGVIAAGALITVAFGGATLYQKKGNSNSIQHTLEHTTSKNEQQLRDSTVIQEGGVRDCPGVGGLDANTQACQSVEFQRQAEQILSLSPDDVVVSFNTAFKNVEQERVREFLAIYADKSRARVEQFGGNNVSIAKVINKEAIDKEETNEEINRSVCERIGKIKQINQFGEECLLNAMGTSVDADNSQEARLKARDYYHKGLGGDLLDYVYSYVEKHNARELTPAIRCYLFLLLTIATEKLRTGSLPSVLSTSGCSEYECDDDGKKVAKAQLKTINEHLKRNGVVDQALRHIQERWSIKVAA